MIEVATLIQQFARGGGGGSGGGGSGGGSIILILGYLPTHFIGMFFRRKMHNPAGLIITMVLTVIYGVLWWFLGSFGAIVSVAAFVGGPAGYFGWFGKISALRRTQAKKQIAAASSSDPAWNEAAITQYVGQVYLAFQNDWSTFNVNNIRTYLTPHYEYHIELMLAALKLRKRRNAVNNPKLLEAFPVNVQNMPDKSDDRVTYYIHGKANDLLIENINDQEKTLFQDNNDFYEYWSFARNGNTWLLDDITQVTENKLLVKPVIKQFAQDSGMYYSADWGWLLLPSQGQLFKGGKFGKSDVNNHVIGVYKNVLVELYSYLPTLDNSSGSYNQYVIAQAGLPKRYESIVVEAKTSALSSMFKRTPKGYNKISLEWPDFNKRYNVYATNVEQVTAFELLHPVYMEKLFALPFKVSIEVADNVVYLYSLDKKADYPTMFSILKDAFVEMRL